MIAGCMSGLVAGIALGAFTGPIGMTFGILLGMAVGLIAGYTLADDVESRAQRTKELDKIIGITQGSMGAGPVSLVPQAIEDADADEEPVYSTKEAWLAEWLTPPPPNVLG
jgi:hypothetical protein